MLQPIITMDKILSSISFQFNILLHFTYIQARYITAEVKRVTVLF